MPEFAAKLIHMIHLLRRVVAEFVVACERPPQPVWLGTRVFVPVIAPPRHKPYPLETWNLLTLRLQRLANRFQSLFVRWQQGTLKPPRPRPAATTATTTPSTRTPKPYIRLPRERGWINKRIDASGQCGGLLTSFLQQPEAERFHAEIPQSARLLRPLCHALAVDPPAWLKLPPRPRRPRPRKPATPAQPGWGRGQRPRTHPYPMLPTDKPLRDYVLATAKAWKKTG